MASSSADIWGGWGSVLFATTIVALVLILIIIATWQSFKTSQTKTLAKAQISRDEAYRELAEQSTNAIKRTANEQERMAADLAELRNRIASIEKMLREVG
jgi:hypothetical protein